jgi:hypothetical protein
VGKSIKKAKADAGQVAKREAARSPLDSWGMDCVGVNLLVNRVFPDDGDPLKAEARASIERSVCDHAAELAGPSPTPVETMLARTIAINWFACRYYDMLCAGSIGSGDLSLAAFERQQRRADRAHRRLLASLRTLATIRRLAVPMLQVNIAQQQVNQVHSAGIDSQDDCLGLCGDEPKIPAALPGPRARRGRRDGEIQSGKKRGARD